MKNYTDHFSTRQRGAAATPQTEKIPGSTQVPNSAGGFSFAVDKWTHLNRFLILGSEGGSYYATEQKLTQDNAKNVVECIKEDGKRAVDTIVAISDAGRAPKNDPALFALALAASFGNDDTKRLAFQALPKVARIGTHLFQFAESIVHLRGWSKAVSRAFNNWYNEREAASLAHQLIKYQNRNGWSHRDIFRLSHIKTNDEDHARLYRWVVKGREGDIPEIAPTNKSAQILWAFEKAKAAGTTENDIIKLVENYHLPWEAIPTDKRTAKVWEALLPNLGLTALIRNLGNLSKLGVLRPGGWTNINIVKEKMTGENLRKARVHPLGILVALNTYASGRGVRGDSSWAVVPDIKDSLDQAFYAAFGNIEPANKRFLLGIDVSGSMDCGTIAGMAGISPRIGAAAMAMVTHRTEPMTLPMGFSHQLVDIPLSKQDNLETVIRKMQQVPMGGTDCSLPMVYAAKNKIEVDTFIVYTDSETWFSGSTTYGGWWQNNQSHGHPVEALKRYREVSGIPAQLIVVGMVSNGFTIADPNDSGMLDVVGFDLAAPQVMRDFAAMNF